MYDIIIIFCPPILYFLGFAPPEIKKMGAEDSPFFKSLGGQNLKNEGGAKNNYDIIHIYYNKF